MPHSSVITPTQCTPTAFRVGNHSHQQVNSALSLVNLNLISQLGVATVLAILPNQTSFVRNATS